MTEITRASHDEGFAFIQQEVKEDTSSLCAVSVIQQPMGNPPAPHSTNAHQDISCPFMSLHCRAQRTLSRPSQCVKLGPKSIQQLLQIPHLCVVATVVPAVSNYCSRPRSQLILSIEQRKKTMTHKLNMDSKLSDLIAVNKV